MTLRLLPYGETAVLVEPDDAQLVLALSAAAATLDGVGEVVPAARTVLIVLDGTRSLGTVRQALQELEPQPHRPGQAGEEITLDVRYDGPDLAATAAEAGLDTDELVRVHAATEHVVAFCGFVPGFAYLTGLPDHLHVARLAQPRTRVPAGSVAIAGEFSAVYPGESPGGWRLLGRTDARLWDTARTPPALLTPGTRVRFRPVES